jgi:AcrR family transcriptional regulator
MATAKQSTGLRARQREKRKESILYAAGELFASAGYDSTSLEQIGSQADVSVPTIYTFFASKEDLLLGLLETDRRLLIPNLEDILASPPSDPVEAILAVALTALTGGYDIEKKSVWREILAASFRGSSERRHQYAKLQTLQTDFLERIINIMRDRGGIKRDVNPRRAARVIHAIGRYCFREFVMDDDLKPDDLRTQFESDVREYLMHAVSESEDVQAR